MRRARATDWVVNVWPKVERGVEDHPKYLHLISPSIGKENTGAVEGESSKIEDPHPKQSEEEKHAAHPVTVTQGWGL